MKDHSSQMRLISSSEIADITGRTRAAVSNWRRDEGLAFPHPAGGTRTRPLFDMDEVFSWLRSRNISFDQDSPALQMWGLINTVRNGIGLRPAVETALTVLTAAHIASLNERAYTAWKKLCDSLLNETESNFMRYASTVSDSDSRWHGLLELPLPSGSDAFLHGVIQLAAPLSPSQHAEVGDQLLERLGTAEGKMGGESGAVNSRVSQLLVNAPTMTEPTKIYDPAMGIGAALLGAHARFPNAEIVGEDLNIRALTIARQRALLAGVKLLWDQGDALLTKARPSWKADLVLTEPPLGHRFDKKDLNPVDPRWSFGIPTSTSELLWIQNTIWHLNDTGRGYLITGRGPLSSTTRGDHEIRSNLLRSGVVEAIIGLPPRMLPNMSNPLALWVLRRPDREADSVLIVNATNEEEPEKHIGEWLEKLRSSNEESTDLPAFTRVSIDRLLAGGANLHPEQWVEVGDVDAEKINNAIQQAVAILQQPQVTLNNYDWFRTPSPSRIVTVKELGLESVVTVYSGNGDPKAKGEEQSWTHNLLRQQKQSETPLPLPPAKLSSAICTEPGDVVVATTGTIDAIVDTIGGHSVSKGLFVVRPLTGYIHPVYLAACLEASWNNRFKIGSTIPRVNIRDLEIPLVSLSDQKIMVERLEAIKAMRIQAKKIEEEANKLAINTMDAIRYDIPAKGI